MAIPSLTFIGFMIAALCVYYLQPFYALRKVVLIACSLYFYASYQVEQIWYLFAVALFAYVMSHFFEMKRNPILLWVGILPILLGLVLFKYAGHSLSLIAPIGISFFSFKAIGYLMDVYNRKIEAEPSFVHWFLYVAFFPQILSGPIQSSTSFLSQIQQKKSFHYETVRRGFLLVFFGVFEKMMIADRLIKIVDYAFADMNNLSFSLALIGCIAYSLQIYADFDAYSNIAIGLTNLFGFECEANFRTPYFSKSLKEFWTRWHISLSTWFKNYLYIPLGGNRKGELRRIINLLIVFAVSGLWHGASWNFLLWGLFHGLIQVIENSIGKIMHHFHFDSKWLKALAVGPSILLNFVLVSLLWVFFKFQSMEEIQLVFSVLFTFDFAQFSLKVFDPIQSEAMITVLLAGLFVLVDLLRATGFSIPAFSKMILPLRWILYAVMIALMIVFATYGQGYDPSKFIYIQF